MADLSVNLNAVAYLRNRRDLPWPSVIDAARLSLGAGASGLTVHPRPDERHIRRTDVFELVELLRAGQRGARQWLKLVTNWRGRVVPF